MSEATQKQKKRSSESGGGGGGMSEVFLHGAVGLPLLLAYYSVMPQHVQRWLAIDTKAAADPTYRLLFTLRWLSPVCLAVVMCIQAVATSRLFSPAIDGRTPHRRTDLLRSILQNTLEQAFMLALNLLALSQNVTAERLALIPMAVGLFCAARLIFAFGYLIRPTARALGFVLTFMPNVLLAGYNVYCLVASLMKP